MKKVLSLISILSLVLMFNACSEEEGTLFELGENDYWSFHSDEQTVNATEAGKSAVYLYHINDAKVSPVNITVDYIGGSESVLSVSQTSINAVDDAGNKAAIEITYDINNLEFNVPYKLEISIPVQEGYALEGQLIDTVKVTVIRPLTFVELGVGSFTSASFEDTWEQLVLSANETPMYQLPDCFEKGKPINIVINGDGTVTIPEQAAWNYNAALGDVFVSGTGTVAGNVVTMNLEHVVKSINYSFGVFAEVLTLPAE
ncbi:MAG: hypothetical protein VB046_03925 [Paludibacter sp.]|nr:hypothetical protein [Paludibacter sp.]